MVVSMRRGGATKTWSAIATVAGEAEAAGLCEALERAAPAPWGLGAMEIEDGAGRWEIAAWYDTPPPSAALALAAAAFDASAFLVSEIGMKDWVREAQRGLPPVRAGGFLVHGSHDRAAAAREGAGARRALEIEAALAFGTGHHGTTRSCLAALDRLAQRSARPRRVLDLGAGTGVLAMAAARLWRAPALATDIDPVAAQAARANAAANRLGPLVATLAAPGFAHPRIRAGAPYDLLLANILAGPLRRLAGEGRAHLAVGGVAVLSGILDRQAAGVEAVWRAHGFARLFRIRDDGWTTLALCRRSRAAR